MIAHAGADGVVTAWRQARGGWRQPLSAWEAVGLAVLAAAFTPAAPGPGRTPAVERAVLTLLVAGRASDRGIHACLAALG